jgi:hypothetical protein
LKELLQQAKDKLAVFPKAVREIFEKHGFEIREVPKSPVLASVEGAIKTLIEKGEYVLMKDGKEIFRGTQKEVKAIADKLKGMSDDVARKYLDELLDTKKLDEVINSKNFEFLKLGLKYEHEFLKFKTGMKEISHYIVDTSNKKNLQGITTIDNEGILFSAFDVTTDYQGKGVSKAMYELIRKYEYQFEKIQSRYTAKTMKDNYEAFMKVYDSKIDNKVEAVFSTPSGKTISKIFNNRYSPTDIIIEEGKGINLYWIKK